MIGQATSAATDNTQETRVDLNTVQATVGKWLLLPDSDLVVEVLLAAVVANRLEGDPFWLFLVNPPSGVKTELINALSGVPDIFPLSDLTPQTFASGLKPDSNEETSLLMKFNKEGKRILALKDFTTVLSMREEKKAEILAQLREIYDGCYVKIFGNGKTVDWQGKLGLIAGVTPIIDRQYSVSQTLGERFVFFRIRSADRRQIARRAIRNQGGERAMRQALRATVAAFLNTVPLPSVALPDALEQRIADLADFCAIARSSVLRNSRGEIDYIPEPEGPGRLAKQLVLFAKALAIVRGKNKVSEEEYKVLYRLVEDTIHANKYALLSLLREGGTQTPITLIEKSRFSKAMVNRYLDELKAFELVKKNGKGGWSLAPEWQEAWERILPTTEPLDGPYRLQSFKDLRGVEI